MRAIYLFDDGLPLAPLTDLRPVFDVRTGALTTFERTELGWSRSVAGVIVPGSLVALTRELHPGIAVNEPHDPDEEAILLNGRWVDCTFSNELGDLEPRTAVVTHDMTLLAACGPARDFARLVREGPDAYTIAERRDGDTGSPVRTLARPWHTRTFRDHALRCDLRLLTTRAKRRPGSTPRHLNNGVENGAHVEPGAIVHPGAILDPEQGPIFIAAGAVVRPGAIIVGPAFIGPHATVLERATICPNSAIGPWCKVNGEISGCIFQGYSNKAHEGFLGDSWVGEWVNLGAGTTNSNLLNTYTEIVAQSLPGGLSEHTGEQFLGAIIGDHVKTAICTRIMTGAVIHTGAMLAQSAPITGCIPPFAWMTDDSPAGRHYRLDKFEQMVRAVMARRQRTPGPAYLERLRALASQREIHRVQQ